VPELPPQPNPVANAFYAVVSAFPGFRDVTPAGFRKPEFDDHADMRRKRKSPAYGDWAADIEVGDDWDYRPGGAPSTFRLQADTRARYPNTNTPRDSFMRPIADPIGVADRCAHSTPPCMQLRPFAHPISVAYRALCTTRCVSTSVWHPQQELTLTVYCQTSLSAHGA
jgi:hypothetical protein